MADSWFALYHYWWRELAYDLWRCVVCADLTPEQETRALLWLATGNEEYVP